MLEKPCEHGTENSKSIGNNWKFLNMFPPHADRINKSVSRQSFRNPEYAECICVYNFRITHLAQNRLKLLSINLEV